MIEPVYIYFIYYLIGMLYCFKIKPNINYFLIFCLLLIWSFALRSYGLSNDFVTYISTLDLDWYYYYDTYYLREPLYWLSSKFIYENISNNPVYVYFILDTIFFLFFCMFCKKNKLPEYVFIVFILFFPSIMGFQNVYRQFLATYFILFSIFNNSEYDKKDLISYFYLLIAFLLHNTAILFLPYIFLKKKKYLLTIMSFVFLVVAFYFFGDGGRSSSDTGDVNPLVYMLAISILFLFYLFLNNFKIKYKDNFFLNSFVLSIGLYVFSIIIMAGGQSKRVGMIILLINLFALLFFLEKDLRIKNYNKVIIRLILFCVLSLIAVLVPSSRDMLVGT
ncbi:hypothetical protein BBP83_02005 [Acinetobacter celticus]|uniref:EpsG family protein n=1 Tax=Acinetobacter celticus TaxID=1891224 RepID=A0A1C3D183_9GAMM|nr:EpsG family protein [Acinetobacter celticus]ODA14597.1 hypothetical protein BBP83_02005 [Acinetobacter celticus]